MKNLSVYSYKYKKSGAMFWKSAKNLIGHTFDEKSGKMVFFHQDGSQTLVANWNSMDGNLGIDWYIWQKSRMEKEAGQQIQIEPRGA